MTAIVDKTKLVLELANLHGASGEMSIGTVIVTPGDVLTLMIEVERLRRECHDLEAVVGNYCTTLFWIANHDQTMKPNGGDPEWFAEQAPIRARRALAE